MLSGAAACKSGYVPCLSDVGHDCHATVTPGALFTRINYLRMPFVLYAHWPFYGQRGGEIGSTLFIREGLSQYSSALHNLWRSATDL